MAMERFKGTAMTGDTGGAAARQSNNIESTRSIQSAIVGTCMTGRTTTSSISGSTSMDLVGGIERTANGLVASRSASIVAAITRRNVGYPGGVMVDGRG